MNEQLFENLKFNWADLPTITSSEGTGGLIRESLEDFWVEEIPLYQASGTGTHSYVFFEKRGLSTRDVVKTFLEIGLKEHDIGVAGQKDKYAVTRQWLSIPASFESQVSKLDDVEGVSVLETSRHKNKLATGHLAGNRFKIRVRGLNVVAASLAQESIQALKQSGIPNYFGPQRFGRFNSNAIDGYKLIKGEKVSGSKQLKIFFGNALQSQLFNKMLAARIKDQLFDQVIIGDWAKKHDTGGVFKVETEQENLRAKHFEISATLPLYGKKIKPSEAQAGQREQQILEPLGLTWSDFKARVGDRRLTRLVFKDASIEAHDDGYTAIFSLPKGSFATTVLRELMKTNVDERLISELDVEG